MQRGDRGRSPSRVQGRGIGGKENGGERGILDLARSTSGLTGSNPQQDPSNKKNGGERGIRTPDRGLAYTRFPSVRLQPLGHLSARVPHKFFTTDIPVWLGTFPPLSPPRRDKMWRKGRDSNPRYPFRYSGFQDRRHQPLGHPSAWRGRKVARIFPNNQWAQRVVLTGDGPHLSPTVVIRG